VSSGDAFPFILPEGWIFGSPVTQEITVIILVLSCHFTPHMRISFEKNTKKRQSVTRSFENLLKFF
ncbi:hypothetical protein D5430_24925, partial [Salmonella enterica]|nr:hypothetical protein [Salmonella enterica]EAV0910290.1 hypothetical protein [Salmonella enterica subsp. enterica serovar Senftenberg]EAT4089030.1 hypothetical protein [Salmonella enterica]EAY2530764.1 hypothetical protein [Salmonella enterica]EBK9932972.1 hypothetical protein [Salmonella enterica subsp. enterica serovar Senftenberg]